MNSFRCLVGLLVASIPLAAMAIVCKSDEAPGATGLDGHSAHGEAFNEGPRRKAHLMEGMPRIDFPVTTASTEAQRFFNQGVGQLHGFWYFEAERSFRQVASLDTNCLMAYWGMALANTHNEKRARDLMQRAADRTNSVALTRRELLYLDALAKFCKVETPGKPSEKSQEKKDDKSAGAPDKAKAKPEDENKRHRDYIRGLEQIIEEFPEDLEARAFLAFKIWENGRRLKIPSHTAVDALARQVLAVDPMHPVHHARIHLWNDEADRRALDSAAGCGPSSPGIAHMWHMPGHTYSKLHRYADTAWQQEASARVDHAYMRRNRVLPDQIHNYAHNNEWLVENLNYLGRVHEGIDLAKNLIELPRHPKFNSLDKPKINTATNAASQIDASASITPLFDSTSAANKNRSNSARYGRQRLLETLVRWELWDELVSLSSTLYLEATDVPAEQARRAHALGLAYFNQGEPARGLEQIAELEAALKRRRAARIDEVDEVESRARQEKEPEDKINQSIADALKSEGKKLKEIEATLAELKIHAALSRDDKDEAKQQLEVVKDLPKERLARIHLALGDTEKALTFSREVLAGTTNETGRVESGTNQVHLLANHVDLLVRSDKKADAQEAFAWLRAAAASADLDMPIFVRLRPVAEELKLPADWRLPATPATDLGERPPLDQLGPRRWSPSEAPAWELTDADGKKHSLRDYRGRPVVVVFYLGFGCSHCIEQLNAFAPMAKQFEQAGLSLIAIGSESAAGVKRTAAKSKAGDGFPFPIVADDTAEVFKAYRAYDDFEQAPLHGTFLIDSQGLVRWQDISYEPFTQPEFLLTEAQRLLKLDVKALTARAASAKSSTSTLQ